MLLSSFKEISPGGSPQQKLKEQKPSFTQTKPQEAEIFKDLARSFLTKANLLPLAPDQNRRF